VARNDFSRGGLLTRGVGGKTSSGGFTAKAAVLPSKDEYSIGQEPGRGAYTNVVPHSAKNSGAPGFQVSKENNKKGSGS